jgi:branched-chain amino acid transport system permease protein
MSGARTWRSFGIFAAIMAACAILPYTPIPDFYIQQAFPILFFAGLAQSWNILGGYTGYLSLGHSSFVGIGGYTIGCFFFAFQWSPFVTFPLAAVSAAILALIIGVICFRIRGSYFLIATMLVLFIMQTLANNLPSITNGADGIDLPLFTSNFSQENRIWFDVGLGLVVLTTLVAFCIERSRLGLNLMAIREDEDVARMMGVKVVHCKAVAFTVSAALAGLLGAAYTYRAHVIEPTTAFSVDMSAAPIMMAILGGSRNWIGPLIGAVVYDAVSNVLALSIGNAFSDMAFAVFLICVVLLLPDGITGAFSRFRAKFAKAEPPSGMPAAVPAKALQTVESDGPQSAFSH